MVSDHIRGSFGMKYLKERRVEVVHWYRVVRRLGERQGHAELLLQCRNEVQGKEGQWDLKADVRECGCS